MTLVVIHARIAQANAQSALSIKPTISSRLTCLCNLICTTVSSEYAHHADGRAGNHVLMSAATNSYKYIFGASAQLSANEVNVL